MNNEIDMLRKNVFDNLQAIEEKDKQLDKYKNVIDKIKEKLNVLNEEPYNATTYIMVITEIYKLLEEVE